MAKQIKSFSILKVRASKIADEVLNGKINIAAFMTITSRKSKPVEMSVLTGLVVGALCDRGKADDAAKYLEELYKEASK